MEKTNKKKIEEPKEVTVEEALKDPVYTNYNLLQHLQNLNVRMENLNLRVDDTNKILLALLEIEKEILEINREAISAMNREPEKVDKKVEREGVIREKK